MADKIIVLIVIFMGISFLMAGILITGAIPQIFQSSENIIKTQKIVNQTQLQLHHDQTLANQTHYQLSEIKRGLYNVYYAITDFVKIQENTTQKILQDQNKTIEEIKTMLNSTNEIVRELNDKT